MAKDYIPAKGLSLWKTASIWGFTSRTPRRLITLPRPAAPTWSRRASISIRLSLLTRRPPKRKSPPMLTGCGMRGSWEGRLRRRPQICRNRNSARRRLRNLAVTPAIRASRCITQPAMKIPKATRGRGARLSVRLCREAGNRALFGVCLNQRRKTWLGS